MWLHYQDFLARAVPSRFDQNTTTRQSIITLLDGWIIRSITWVIDSVLARLGSVHNKELLNARRSAQVTFYQTS